MKVSLVTACRNAANTIGMTLESVRRQRIGDFELEYIVVDGQSTDGTAEIVRDWSQGVVDDGESRLSVKWISECDRGLYDAINKGIRMASGDIVGILNADDILADDDTICKIVCAFDGVDAVYADVRFVKDAATVDSMRMAKTVRYCTGRFFRPWQFRFATFPAHPSTFIRKACFDRYGLYSLNYRICADFELMLRFFYKNGISTRYLPICTTVMRTGGISTKNLRSNLQINREDLRALRANGVWSCLPLVYLKYFAKIWGFVRRHSNE